VIPRTRRDAPAVVKDYNPPTMTESPDKRSQPPAADKNNTARPGKRSYPRRPSPIPEEQLAKDRDLSRKLYRVIYSLPFLIVAIALLFYYLTRS